MAIRRGTTPTITITAEGIDLRGSSVYVTIAQADRKLTKRSDDSHGEVWTDYDGINSEVYVILSQNDTLYLRPGNAEIQIRWIDADENAHASDIKRIQLGKTLMEGVIKHGR